MVADDGSDGHGDFSAGSINKRILVLLPAFFPDHAEDSTTVVRLFYSRSLRLLALVGISADSAEANCL
jgi:hypothetical protein